MKAQGKRQKGSRLERKVAELIRRFDLDKNAKRMVLSGGDWAFRGDINTILPFTFECKSQEKMKFWEWWQQAEDQAKPMKPPVLVHSSNYRPIIVSMKIETFLDILKEQVEVLKKPIST